ncbi:MAG: response regulator transcription factor [Actinomycetota bacterium]|nr:response regulator transcription factor [Actinomycetota bacterium]
MVDHARMLEWGHSTPAPPAATPPATFAEPDSPVLLVGADPWWEPNGLSAALEAAGWAWVAAGDPGRARWLASIRRVSLVVVGGGAAARWEVVRELRSVTVAPIVVLSDDASETAPLVAAGVDSVLTAADTGESLFAQLLALLRRSDHRRGTGTRFLHAGDLVVDLWTQTCTRAGIDIGLSPTEYALLTFLMTRPDVAIPNATIVRRVWEWMPSDGRNALRIIVNRLRRKLEDDPREPTYIASVRGIGYRFVAHVTEVADAAEQNPDHVDVTPLLQSLSTLADELHDTVTVADAGARLLSVIDAAGLADGIGLFRSDGTIMRLVGSLNMPESWVERVAEGVPLDPSFASAHSMMSGQVVQFADVRTVSGHFEGTARQLAADGFRACHFVPITHHGHAWGHLGLVRRSSQPLDVVAMSYLGALCSVFLLHVHSRCTPDTQ